MTTTLFAAALWGIVSLGGPSSIATGPEPARDSIQGPEHVPFVAQEPLLCGGAAAAMLLRYWGERHVHGDDFEHLVRREEGGIATTDLVEEIRRRGYEPRRLPSSESVFRALERDLPSILLLEGDPTLHYVVLVRAGPRHVWIHDPNFGPDRRLTRSELDRLWSPSGHWAVTATPRASTARAGDAGVGARSSEAPSAGPEATPAAAETSPPVADAMSALRAGDHALARARARALLADPPTSLAASRAHRILATSHYLEGSEVEALGHWNELSEPTLDLVEIRGARHTRHHVLARRLALQPGTVLTQRDLRMARRRLGDLQALRRTRVDYRPLPDGSAEVQAFVTERGRWPGVLDGLGLAVGAATDQRASLEVGPFVASGDRWRLAGSWQDAQSFASASLTTPTLHLPGVLSLGLEWRRERFGLPASAAPGETILEERLRGFVELAEWVTPALAIRAEVGMERWPARDVRMASMGLGASWHGLQDDLRASASAGHWRGGLEPFTRAALSLDLRRSPVAPVELAVYGGAIAVTSTAPAIEWPGAGAGETRAALLRGHPLTDGAVIQGPAFGRRLVHATGEVRLVRRVGPFRYGGAFFVDLARAWDRSLTEPDPAEPSPLLVDPGMGLFLDTGDRELRVDLARGDDRWVLSAGVRTGR